MSPTPRAAGLLAAVAVGMLVVPPELAALAAVAVVAAAVADGAAVRRIPEVERRAPVIVSRGVTADIHVGVSAPAAASAVRVRQPRPADVDIEPDESDRDLVARLTAHRRGRHVLPAVATRVDGPLGLGRRYARPGRAHELLVYPDLVSARRIATAARSGRYRGPGGLARGALGLGTEFESVRDYQTDDDVRQVNWTATARLGRPMSNQHRIEQDRDVICVVDSGRLMGAPIAGRTRLDASLDAVAALAAVADDAGDRIGAIAFDGAIARRLSPTHSGGAAVVRALFDLEHSEADSDYELAFRAVGRAKRAFVVVFTDILEEAAARALVAAVPILARHHHVVVASCTDTDLTALIEGEPASPHDVFAAAVALDVLAERRRVAVRLRHAGAEVLEAEPGSLGAACAERYLRAKARARL